MPPLNQAERGKAFLNFLIFFSVTITVIVIVIFFSIEVPFTDNNRLRAQVSALKDQGQVSKSLQGEINEVTALINALDAAEVNRPAVEAQIEGRINTITSLVRTNVSDSETVRYYSRLTNDLLRWKNLKRNMNTSRSSEEEVARLKQEIVLLNTQLAQKEQTINNLLQQRQ